MPDTEAFVVSQKVKLFISSGMAGKSLQSIRNRIQELLKNSPYVSGWLFEHAGASTLDAETAYTMQVADANVCAFIIDGRCEIPEGVQKEIDEASRRNKKCLYYFYKVSHDGPRKLLVGLRGPDKPKYREMERLRDIPSQLERDIVEEIFFVYRSYTRGDVSLSRDGDAPTLSPVPEDAFVDRSALAGFSACHTVMSNFLLGLNTTPDPDGDLDRAAADFLEAIYVKAAPHELRVSALLAALESHLPEQFYPTISLRWRAIHQYYLNDLPEALALEEQALDTARDSGLPAWFVDDILIDLRNLQAEADRERGVIWRPGSYQEEIDNRNREIQLPLVDRMNTNLLESMLAEELKGRVQSAYVITLGSKSDTWVDMLVKLFVATVHYGSYTHALLLARRMRLVASYIWQTTENRAALITELKLALVTDSEKNIRGFLATNGQLLGYLTCEEADSAFRFAWGAASGHRRDETRTTALATLGPFLSDVIFNEAMDDAKDLCKKLLADAPIPPGSLNRMLSQCAPRDTTPWMINLTVAAMDIGPNTYWAQEALQFLASGSIGTESLSEAQADAIITALGRQANSGKADKNDLIRAIGGIGKLPVRQADWFASFEDSLSSGQKTSLAIALDEVNDELANRLLRESLERIRTDNSTQGVGGMWSRGIDHYERAEALLSGCTHPPIDIPRDLAVASAETLIAPEQSTDAKWGACLLLLYLLGNDPKLRQDGTILGLLRSLDDESFTSISFLSLASYNEDNARIACMAVREAYGVIEPGSLRMALLKKHWGTPGELGRLAKLLGHLVTEELWELIDDDTVFCSLEFLLSLTTHESNEVRRSAIGAVLPMTKHPKHARPTCAALVRVFASSHPESKHAILDALESGGAFDSDERSSIIKTASSSSCYYVRVRVSGDNLED